jgi:hypothetical protein
LTLVYSQNKQATLNHILDQLACDNCFIRTVYRIHTAHEFRVLLIRSQYQPSAYQLIKSPKSRCSTGQHFNLITICCILLSVMDIVYIFHLLLIHLFLHVPTQKPLLESLSLYLFYSVSLVSC